MSDAPLSTGQVAEQLGVPIWAVRRAVDSLLPDTPRCGQNRIIPPEAVKQLAVALGKPAVQPK